VERSALAGVEVVRGPAGDVSDEDRLTGAQDAERLRLAGALAPPPADVEEHPLEVRVGEAARDLALLAVAGVGDVDAAPIGDLRNDEVDDVRERLLVVQRSGDDHAGAGEELERGGR
jgi:hypothetical protein